MKKNEKYFLSVILLFSFCLISFGIFLTFNNKIIDPVDGVVATVSKTDLVNITDNADSKTESLPSDNSDLSNNDSSNNDVTSNDTGNSSSYVVEQTPETNSVPYSPPSSNSEALSTPTIQEVNNKLRLELQSKYGITIKYGNETNGYNVGGLSTSAIADDNKAAIALEELATNLSYYPSGFFKEFEEMGLKLTVYLIDKYSESDVTGVTDPSSNNVVISIATYFSFSESFHHETYHYMEKYIKLKGGSFGYWQQYNPADFIYGSTNSSLSFDRTNKANSFFVNDYAQTDEYEDRASTFEYMMANSKASCLNTNEPVWGKAVYMAKVIDVFFNTVNSYTTEYWERFL